MRRHGTGAAYLVSGAALKAINGVYSQSGESDGVPKYAYSRYSLLRRTLSGGTRCWYVTDSARSADATKPGATPKCYYCCRSAAGTPPLEVQWERGTDGLLPGPFLTPISMTHAPPTSVLAPLQAPPVPRAPVAGSLEPPCSVCSEPSSPPPPATPHDMHIPENLGYTRSINKSILLNIWTVWSI